MKKMGFTLVESLVAVFILTITILSCIKFYKSTVMSSESIDNLGYNSVNLKIGHEFIVGKVQEATTIKSLGNEYYIDGYRIFIEKNILRYSSASQHIAPSISSFKIEHLSNNLYRVSVVNNYDCLSSIVKRGDYIEK